MGGRGRPRRARRAQTDCRQAAGGVYRCCMCLLVGGGWRAWRNVHRRRDPGRAVPGGASRGAWADAGGGGASLPPTRGCMGGSSEPAWAAAPAPVAPPPVPQRVFLPRSRVSGKGAAVHLCFSPERGKCCSAGCSLEHTFVGACSVQFLDLGAVPARCNEQNTRWNHNSWQPSTTVETCSGGCRPRSAFTSCMSMKGTRMKPPIIPLWCLRGGNLSGTAHSGAGAARTLI